VPVEVFVTAGVFESATADVAFVLIKAICHSLAVLGNGETL
jgi:hypothetical protein